MGASSVTGTGPGMSNGQPKPENHCGCGCPHEEYPPDPPSRKFCYARHKSGNIASHKSGGNSVAKVCWWELCVSN